MNKLEKVLKALANRRRLAIVALLRKKKRVCVSDIARALSLSVKATSKHLGILRQVDIVEHVQESLVVYYFLAPSLPPFVQAVLPYIPNSCE